MSQDKRQQARKQKMAVIVARINEIACMFPYVATEYRSRITERLDSLNRDLARLKGEARREENIPLESEQEVEQYILIIH